MKNLGKNSASIILGACLIAGVLGLTIFSSVALINHLNKEADKAYVRWTNVWEVAAANEVSASTGNTASETSEPVSDQMVNDNGGDAITEPSEDGTVSAYQLSEGTSSNENIVSEDVTSVPSDTISDADDSTAVTYPYYIGTEFVVVDPEGNMVYLVKKGDTLSLISGLVGYSVDELAEYNKIHNVNLIYADESLRIPADEDLIESVRKYIEAQEGSDVGADETLDDVED